MVEKIFSSLGVDFKHQVPASIEEFDLNAKKSNACLDEAINNVVYRNSLAEFRDAFIYGLPALTPDLEKGITTSRAKVAGLQEISGIPRKTKTEKRGDKEVQVPDESEATYVKRVAAEKGWEGTDDAAHPELQAIADAIAPHILFDASATERKAAGPKKLPEDYLNAAKRIFANGNQEVWAKKFGLTLTGDAEKDTLTVGWKIREVELKKQRERTLEYA